MRSSLALAAVLVVIVCLAGCAPKQTGTLHEPRYDSQLPEGKLALRKIDDPNQIPDFTKAFSRLGSMRMAIRNSLNYLSKSSSQRYFPYGDITHQQAVDSLKAFEVILNSRMTPRQMNDQVRRKFDVYVSIGYDNKGTVLYTGYYTPIFDASEVRTEKFRYPLYKAPANLVKDSEGNTLGIRAANGSISPCPARREIESRKLMAGSELVWLGDPFDAYVANIQGSARLRMPDGMTMSVGYAANNGYDYHSVREELVRDGIIPSDKANLITMTEYFKAHPDQVNSYLWRNPRYVFFTQDSIGPRGSLNESVTPWRSIATDKAVFPRACLAMVRLNLPIQSDNSPELAYDGFALDQDTGGAIRAAGRADIYLGIGPTAGDLAGRIRSEGMLYYLFLKPSATAAAGSDSKR